MKLRDKTNIEICEENNLPYTVLTNVVEEKNTKNKMRTTSELIAKALIATLGPYGSNTIIQDRSGNHFATKDGYDLMNRISFEDEVARTILDLFRTTASNQVFNVGDGSTSAIVVANALFQSLTDPEQIEHFKKIAPKDITDILNDLSKMIEVRLKEIALPVSEDMHELDVIAAIANNNDTETGKLIGDIYRKVGQHGFISMDVVNKQEKDTYELKQGIEWGRGYIDSIYAQDSQDDKIIYDGNTRVIISNSYITYDDLEKYFITLMKTAMNQEGVQLLIVSNGYDDDVVQFLKQNRTKHLRIGSKDLPMDFTPVDIAQTTVESKNTLEDLALLCGCEIIDKVKYDGKEAQIVARAEQFIGRAGKVIITPKTTQVTALDKLPERVSKEIKSKIKEIDNQLSKLKSIEVPTKEEDMKIYNLRTRRARLTSTNAVLHVGGKTMAERMTRQRLIEDAIFACKSTLVHGYIPGGNICIPKILMNNKEAFASVLGEKYTYLPIDNIRSFFAYFIDMLSDAFLESYRAVLSNSYMTEEIVTSTIETCLKENKFYNLKTHSYEDWDKTNVINSADTDIQILKSCISIIGILSMSNQFITLNLNVTDQIKK